MTKKTKEKKSTGKKIAIFITLFSIFLFFTLIVVSACNTKKSFANSIDVYNAKIAEKVYDNNYYIRLTIDGKNINPDDMWVEVNSNFYNMHALSSYVGILMAGYDVYEESRKFILFGTKSLEFEKTVWSIENIYNSYEDALNANPRNRFSMNAVLVSKKKNEGGKCFLVLNANGKRIKTYVSPQMYNQCAIGQNMNAEFESFGNFISLAGITPYNNY